jgi:hypothetical protein
MRVTCVTCLVCRGTSKKMATDEDRSIRKYTRTARLVTEGVAFQLLRNQVTVKAMKLLETEWKAL